MSSWLRSLTTRLFRRQADLTVPCKVWEELLVGLRERGQGRRESGAFLLGAKDRPRKVTLIVFYDEVDPAAFDTGIIEIDGGCMAELWRICRERNLVVIADVHTHPGGVGMSESDRKHPIIAEPGHVAMIVPRFAAAPVRPADIGLYRYRGQFHWDVLCTTWLRPSLYVGGAP